MEDRKQYDHTDTNVYFKFARGDLDQMDMGDLHLPVPEAPKVSLSDLKIAPKIDYFDDPLKR